MARPSVSHQYEQAEPTNARKPMKGKTCEVGVVGSTRACTPRGQAEEACHTTEQSSGGRPRTRTTSSRPMAARASTSTLRVAPLPSWTAQSLSRV